MLCHGNPWGRSRSREGRIAAPATFRGDSFLAVTGRFVASRQWATMTVNSTQRVRSVCHCNGCRVLGVLVAGGNYIGSCEGLNKYEQGFAFVRLETCDIQ